MKKNKVSIEYSHIYTNESFSKEHRQSVDVLKELLVNHSDDAVTTFVLIDNYNSTEHLLEVDEFLEDLEKEGNGPDFYAFEEDMGLFRDQMLSSIADQRVFRSYERYINGKNHMPCSFMTAIWYLIRLGYLIPEEGVIHPNKANNFVPADHLINILPDRFRGVERKTIALLKATEYSEATRKIESVLFS